jgi:LPPG:FO 2-phospho-L-lactate transferase
MIAVLAGGIGAARFLQGLLAVHRPSDVTIVSNVGDDAEFFGLHVSPDIDAVLYHLAGMADEQRGFGIKDDTFHVLEALRRFGYDTWFSLGDRDIATCVARTDLLRRGRSFAEATDEIARALGVPARVLPAAEDRLRTVIRTDDGLLDFQDWMVKRQASLPAREIVLDGADSARPTAGVLEAISGATAVLITPSNPLVSIGPILAVPGLRETLRGAKAKVVAVSPIIAGATIKGPAARMLRDQGLEASAAAVAGLYGDFLDVFVIDNADAALKPEIEAIEPPPGRPPLEVVVTDTIMNSMDKKTALARAVLEAAGVGA